MSSFDNVKFTSSMYYYYEDHFNCEKKVLEYGKRVGLPKAKEIVAKENGCNSVSDKQKYLIDNISYNTCVCKFKFDDLWFFLNILDKYNKGILPYEGALLDQPSKLIEILDRINYVKQDIETRIVKKEE